MKALSLRQPYAWLVVNGHKDVENRPWRTAYRGPLLIHAGLKWPTGVYNRLLFHPDLSPSNTTWTAITPPLPDGWINGSNALITLQDTNIAASAQRFYRIEAKSLSAP